MKIALRKIMHVLFTGSVLLCVNEMSAQCTIPSSVTATPSVVCAGSTSSLNATSAGSAIQWYTVASCGVPTGTSASGANFTVAPVNTTTYYAEAFAPPLAGGTTTLNYTGCPQQIIIPAGVSSITIAAFGAQGGTSGYTGANGGAAAGVLTVTPGQVLNIFVGGMGTITAGGYNGGGVGGYTPAATYGGGGGGATDIRIGGIGLANRVLVAGGGGGSGGSNSYNATGGTGGGGIFCASPNGYGGAGANGCALAANGNCNGGLAPNYGTGGGGGGLSSGGPIAGSGTGVFGTAGVLGIGGDGGNYVGRNGGGGGGGGYYGGAGGMSGSGGCNGGGGGGSSFGDNTILTSITFTPGFQTGNGQVIIIGLNGGCVSAARTPVTVTVNPSPTLAIAGGTAVACPGSSVSLIASGAVTYTWSNGANSASIAATPTANTTYSVMGSAAGCTGTAAVNVTVSPTPTISVTGNTLICGTGTNVLTASGGVTYSWSTGATTSTIGASPSVTTVYTVVGTGTLAGNCSGNSTVSIIVSSNPTVVVTGGGTICAGNSTVLTAGGANTYSWNTGATTTTISVSPTVNTTYTAIGTNTAGCANTATAGIVVSPCTGLQTSNLNLQNLLVYPNPSNGEFTVELKNGLNKTIEVTDLTGRVILSNTTSKDKVNVNISHLANGIYYVKVQSNNAVEVIKIMKQ
jgi:hypothetical protein